MLHGRQVHEMTRFVSGRAGWPQQTCHDGVLHVEGGDMKKARIHIIALCTMLGILNACTITAPTYSSAPLSASPVMQTTPQLRASDRMLYWIEEARELHTMAKHREHEAELAFKQQPGPETDEFVKQMRLFAHRLEETAEYARIQAQEAEREIPPDMIMELQSALLLTR
jgi:hypothetical protein